MKKTLSFVIVLFLLAIGFLFSWIQNQAGQIVDLQSAVSALKQQVETLQLVQARQGRVKPTVITRQVVTATGNSLKDQVFKFLYQINGNASSEDASLPKKIRYLPGQLIVQDLSVIQDDRFFDLLGVLLDEDAVKKVELPSQSQLEKSQRAAFRSARTELLQFGLSSELLAPSADGKFRININNLNK